MCAPGTVRNFNNECIVCEIYKGYKVENGYCVCAQERGMIIDERGNCVCPEDRGLKLTPTGECTRIIVPGCKRNEDCHDYQYCDLGTKTCEDPCKNYECGVNAFCNATNHGNTFFKKNYFHSKFNIYFFSRKMSVYNWLHRRSPYILQ